VSQGREHRSGAEAAREGESEAPAGPPPIRRVLESCLYSADIPRARDWYRRVLGLTESSFVPGRHVFFPLAEGMLLIFDARGTSAPGGETPAHGASGPGHLAFEAAHEDLPRWRERLERLGVEIERQIDWPAGGKSLYFRDADGNSLELATRDVWRRGG
jgi:catechol 2,3-dioxygenase-like lactoylglutathione lyase family enzyme